MDLAAACTTLGRYLWAAPTTFLGVPLLGAALITRGRVAIVNGVLEAHGGGVGRLLRICTVFSSDGVKAMTLGHIVLGQDQHCLDRSRAHERVHVRQCERWGPFFVPAYLTASVIAVLRGKHAYYDNWFERQARD
ncbi:MAG: hypothetical protein ACT4NU_03660 [Chromatiales bacterium]